MFLLQETGKERKILVIVLGFYLIDIVIHEFRVTMFFNVLKRVFRFFVLIFSVEPNRTKVYLLAEWLLAFSGIHELTKFENVVLRFYIKSVVNLHITCYAYVR